jgi:hypothetical protein
MLGKAIHLLLTCNFSCLLRDSRCRQGTSLYPDTLVLFGSVVLVLQWLSVFSNEVSAGSK